MRQGIGSLEISGFLLKRTSYGVVLVSALVELWFLV